jgi:hypothetical protein
VMRQLLFQFLDADLPAFNGPPLQKQILSLGAGFDTSFFQLVKEGRIPHIFVEVDFSEVPHIHLLVVFVPLIVHMKIDELVDV